MANLSIESRSTQHQDNHQNNTASLDQNKTHPGLGRRTFLYALGISGFSLFTAACSPNSKKIRSIMSVCDGTNPNIEYHPYACSMINEKESYLDFYVPKKNGFNAYFNTDAFCKELLGGFRKSLLRDDLSEIHGECVASVNNSIRKLESGEMIIRFGINPKDAGKFTVNVGPKEITFAQFQTLAGRAHLTDEEFELFLKK